MPDETFGIHPDSVRCGGWSWAEPRDGEHFRRCSFCGSVHPEDLASESAWSANWADWKYGWPHKFYVDIPNRDPSRLCVVSVSSGPRGGRFGGTLSPVEIPWTALTSAQREVVIRGGHWREGDPPPAAVGLGTHAYHFGKFYTIHLSDPRLDPAVVGDIERRSGIAFTFTDGRVSWRAT